MAYSPMELAEAFLKTGEFQDALDALDAQLTQHPDDAEARRLRMQLRLRLGDEHLAGAEEDFDALDTPDGDDWQTLSVIYERQGRQADAIHALMRARELAPDSSERLTEAILRLLISAGEYDEALALIQTQPRSWRWLEREGDLLVELGNDLQATARYGLVLAQLEQREGAMRPDYLAALKGRVLLVRAHAYRRLGEIDIAAEHYRAAQSLLPADPRIDFNLGLLRWLAGDHDAAREQCAAALATTREDDRDALLMSIRDDSDYAGLAAILTDGE